MIKVRVVDLKLIQRGQNQSRKRGRHMALAHQKEIVIYLCIKYIQKRG